MMMRKSVAVLAGVLALGLGGCAGGCESVLDLV